MELPPCIRKAVAARDKDALDEVFSFLRSFADDETREAVLWSIGYYDLGNYRHRKLTAEAQIRGAPFFVCTPLEKPEHLKKYCTPEDEATCPLRDPVKKFSVLIESVYLEYRPRYATANFEVRLRDGTAFTRRNAHYHPFNDATFWEFTVQRFMEWYEKTHHGEFADVVYPDAPDLKRIFMDKLRVVVRNDAPAVHQEDAV